MMPEWLGGLLSGLAIALFGVIAAAISQRKLERKRRREAAQFEVYMRLLELKGKYFAFVVIPELSGRSTVTEEEWQELHRVSMAISDKLREMEDMEYLEEILRILFADDFDRAWDRDKALEEVINKLADKIHPRFAKVMRKIGEHNLARITAGVEDEIAASSNAPGWRLH